MFTKNLSYFDGDTLYPHYDSITGQMTLFARRYSDYDEEGKELISWVEVWDNKKMYRYRQDKRGIAGAINKVKQYFGIEGCGSLFHLWFPCAIRRSVDND